MSEEAFYIYSAMRSAYQVDCTLQLTQSLRLSHQPTSRIHKTEGDFKSIVENSLLFWPETRRNRSMTALWPI